MPQSVVIGMLVLGGVLLLVAITGGKFKLFGAEVDSAVSSKSIRLLAGLLGVVFILVCLGKSAADGALKGPADPGKAALTASGPDPNAGVSNDKYAMVFDPPTNVRAEPSTTSQILCSVTAKKAVRILGSEGNFYKTDVCNGQVGYIHRSQVK